MKNFTEKEKEELLKWKKGIKFFFLIPIKILFSFLLKILLFISIKITFTLSKFKR